jgi:nicotinamidase-related amidase
MGLVVGVEAGNAVAMPFEDTSTVVRVTARPGDVVVDPRRTAVIVVDMQHDFAAPQGMFALAGIPVDGIQAVVEPTRRVLAVARQAGIAIVYLVMQFDEDLSDLGSPVTSSSPSTATAGSSKPTSTTSCGGEGSAR